MPSPSELSVSGTQRFVVVSPTYDHGRGLPAFLEALQPLELPIIFVDDGSSDNTRQILRDWLASSSRDRFVVTHGVNLGKAAALLSGFARAQELGYTHALSIDSDGQHAPSDLRGLSVLAIEFPRAIIIGARPRTMPGCPWASVVGRRFSNFFVWVASGIKVGDSQSGMRCYPLVLTASLQAKAGRYAFETEILTRAGWAGMRVIETPIGCTYELSGGRVTHFRLIADTWDAVRMNARLMTRALLPGHPVPRLAACEADAPAREEDPMIGTILHRAWWWLGPKRLVLMARGDKRSRERLAASVATGFFMATVPLYGIKTVVCLWLAARFQMHPAIVVGVSSLSTPPLGFAFMFLSLVVGHFLLHSSVPSMDSLPSWSSVNVAGARGFLSEWIVGSIIVGTGLAMLSYVVVWLLLMARLPRQPKATP